MKERVTAAVITVSDRSHRGEREDSTGPALIAWLEENGYNVCESSIVPDEKEIIAETLIAYSDKGITLVLTTGGTGCAPRDVTPEATESVIEKSTPGFAEVMRARSLQITEHAMLSRAVSGILKNTLIINLPGSPKGALENLSFIQKALPHACDLLKDEVTDCGVPIKD